MKEEDRMMGVMGTEDNPVETSARIYSYITSTILNPIISDKY